MSGTELHAVRKSSQQGIVQQLFPLFSQSNVSESDLINFLQFSFPGGPNNSGWLTTDYNGDSLLHKAVEGFKPQVVKFLLSQKPELTEMSNAQGFTPLQLLEDKLDSIRHPFLGAFYRGPPFTGFSHACVQCLAALRGQEPVVELPETTNEKHLSSLKLSEDIVIRTLRIKFGCTCGQCVAGFLSPRMRYALSDFAKDYIINVKGRKYMKTAGSSLERSARAKLRNGSPFMQDGYILICSYIDRLCSEEKMIPSERNILEFGRANQTQIAAAALQGFLRQGGTVAAVAKDIFEVANIYFEMEDDEFSDPELPFNKYLAHKSRKGKEKASDEEVLVEVGKELPRCANDKEMSFVQMMCGY